MPRRPNYDRDDLIQRARDLFWRRGWAGTSMKDLEAELKLKPGSFYAAFGSKDALFKLALERYYVDGTERLDRLAAEHGALKALQVFPVAVIENEAAASKACMLSKTLLELQAHGHELAQQADEKLQGMEEKFAALFAQAQARGEIAGTHDPKRLAAKYQSDLIGLRVSAERSATDARAIADEMAEGLGRL
ncbi:MAG: TetR/AcrR family transcriptional regulator [Pseudomonadota bacterium]